MADIPKKTPNGNKLFIVASFLNIKNKPAKEPNIKEENTTGIIKGHPNKAPKSKAILPSPQPIHFPRETNDIEKKKSEPIRAPNKLSGNEGTTRDKMPFAPCVVIEDKKLMLGIT